MRKDLNQKRNDLIQDIIFQNGELHGRIRAKNISIAERIKELSIMMRDQDIKSSLLVFIEEEIDWLTKLADI